MATDNYLVGARKRFSHPVLYAGGVGSATLTGALTLTSKSSHFLRLDPNGADRTVTLPAAEDGLWFHVRNTADAGGEDLTLSDGSAVVVVKPGQAALVVSDGSDWYVQEHLAEPEAVVGRTIPDPGDAGAIPVDRDGVCAMTSAGAETRTLADPTFLGQRLVLVADTYVGNIVVTAASAVNVANNNTLTFGAVSEACELVAVSVGGSLVWQVGWNDGVGLTTV